MPFDWIVFGAGTLGGVLAEILKWFQLRDSPNLPEYIKSPLYWIITVLIALAGGVLAVVYGLDSGKLLLALNVGISAPMIIKGLAATAPPQPITKSIEKTRALPRRSPSVLNFLAGR